ncbi:DUF4249 family protein [Winogradskyella sp.]|uniref:DUF4249 family protein n=1 Tax=Winogradskyella sp. TaxID=1883156 RepID=UPI0026227C39|nr:DUF4249 family protein [Winogradskyella sp.]
MKKLLYIILMGFFIIACEDVIELETPTGETRINIDAHFRVFTQEEPIRATGRVVLTETVNFFDDNIPAVSNATVTITERESGTIYPFVEATPGTGIYESTDLLFLNDFDAMFDLHVEADGEVYSASAQPIRSAPILEIQQGDLEIFGEEDLELIVTISDTAGIENYYLFDFGFNLYQPLDDQFFDGNEFEFSFLYTEDDEVNLQPGDVVTVINDGVDEQFFTYMELLLEQTDSGGFFSSPPTTARGNVINQANPDAYPLGYFRISEAFTLNYTVQED